ncbi:hypothetical protein [Bradyrhizobium brasilense]|uniref:hypothetical protein n=1 Tax=Bradyrhizobium brasilense TaxID=1419277 RepID=UPI001E4D0D07|nr:hypothetical protein [Bradyrhizobium brasilense]MCC8972378.1 hypothetical protein [Bradyrhizobium brasilense]
MFNEDIARIRARRGNTRRCGRLLKTRLSDLERRYIEGLLSEERAASRHWSEAFPVSFAVLKHLGAPSSAKASL